MRANRATREDGPHDGWCWAHPLAWRMRCPGTLRNTRAGDQPGDPRRAGCTAHTHTGNEWDGKQKNKKTAPRPAARLKNLGLANLV